MFPMQGRSKTKPRGYPENWVVSEEMTWNGRKIVPGTELSITGKRGRYRFQRLIQVMEEVDGEKRCVREWIDTVGGATRTRSDMAHSFYPWKIKTVHRINKTRANQETK